MRLYLVRHAPTHEKRMIGWTNAPGDLSDTAQLARLRAALPDAPVVASDLARARATADALTGHRPRLPHQPGLREIYFGAWEGATFAEAEARNPSEISAFWQAPGPSRAPGGESWHDLQTRVNAALAPLITPHSALIVVCHFGPILTQIERYAPMTTVQAFGHKIDPLSLTIIDTETGPLQINHHPQ
jgi:alpha-ribazole phosphatase